MMNLYVKESRRPDCRHDMKFRVTMPDGTMRYRASREEAEALIWSLIVRDLPAEDQPRTIKFVMGERAWIGQNVSVRMEDGKVYPSDPKRDVVWMVMDKNAEAGDTVEFPFRI